MARAPVTRIARVAVLGGEKWRAGLQGIERATYRAGLKGVAIRTRMEQERIRDIVDVAFPGRAETSNNRSRASNAVRSVVYDNGPRGAAGLVYSKFGRGSGAAFVDFILPRLLGTTVEPRRGKYLAIPMPGLKLLGFSGSLRFVSSLEDFGGRKLDWIRTRSGGFVVRDRRTNNVLFILVKRVTFAARISRANLLAGGAHQMTDEVVRTYLAEARGQRI